MNCYSYLYQLLGKLFISFHHFSISYWHLKNFSYILYSCWILLFFWQSAFIPTPWYALSYIRWIGSQKVLLLDSLCPYGYNLYCMNKMYITRIWKKAEIMDRRQKSCSLPAVKAAEWASAALSLRWNLQIPLPATLLRTTGLLGSWLQFLVIWQQKSAEKSTVQ